MSSSRWALERAGETAGTSKSTTGKPSTSTSASLPRSSRNTLHGEDAWTRHQRYVERYLRVYERDGGKARMAQLEARKRNDWDVLKERHRFIREEASSTSASPQEAYEDQVAAKYYENLFKEYAVADLKHFKSGDVALRWRTEDEVIEGIGQFTCGNTRCDDHKPSHARVGAALPVAPDPELDLEPYELNFAYMEPADRPAASSSSSLAINPANPGHGSEEMVQKEALVKVVLCRRCAKKLNYKRDRERRDEEEDKGRGRREGRRSSGSHRDDGAGRRERDRSRSPTRSADERRRSHEASLKRSLEAGRYLAGQSDSALPKRARDAESSKDENAGMNDLLSRRLQAYRAARGGEDGGKSEQQDDEERERVETATGAAALEAMTSIHEAELGLLASTSEGQGQRAASKPNAAPDAPWLGVNDLKTVRLLLGLVANWHVGSLLIWHDRCVTSILGPSKPPQASTSRFEELPSDKEVEERKRRGLADLYQARSAIFKVLAALQRLLEPLGPRPEEAKGLEGPEASQIRSAALHALVPHVLALAIRIVFVSLPPSKEEEVGVARVKGLLSALLKTISTRSAIAALSAVESLRSFEGQGQPRSGAGALLPFVKSAITLLLSGQMLRPDGVQTLVELTAGGQGGGGADFARSGSAASKNTARLDSLATLLCKAPGSMAHEAWMGIVAPQLLDVLEQDSPSTPEHKQAAVFVLARMAEKQPHSLRSSLGDRIYAALAPELQAAQPEGIVVTSQKLARSVHLLSAIVAHAEPSPSFLHLLVADVAPQLFLIATCRRTPVEEQQGGRTTDLRELAWEILRAWVRLGDAEDVAAALGTGKSGLILRAQRGFGKGAPLAHEDDDQGRLLHLRSARDGIRVEFGVPPAPSLAGDIGRLLSSMSISTGEREDKDDEAEELPAQLAAALDLHPDPERFTELLFSASRKDIAGSVLLSILDAYAAQKMVQDETAGVGSELPLDMLPVLYLQLVAQMLQRFGPDLLLGAPRKVLAFVSFALGPDGEEEPEEPEEQQASAAQPSFASPLEALLNVGRQPAQSKVTEASQSRKRDELDEELASTAVNLLLSMLEGNPTLSAANEPLIAVLDAKLAKLSDAILPELRASVKEARLVIEARSAADVATSGAQAGSTVSPAETQRRKGIETYQEALKHLQDPILPVRAHGLVLLRELALASEKGTGGRDVEALRERRGVMDPALRPAIYDVLLRAVQEEESFLYLNAVKGLSALATSSPDDRTLQRLVEAYVGRRRPSSSSSSVAGEGMAQSEADLRLRLGEVLLQVLQRTAEAAGPRVPALAAPLMAAVRDASLPTTLRASVVSVLGTLVEAAPLAVATSGTASELCSAMLDLLTVEVVQRAQPVRGSGRNLVREGDGDEDQAALDSATSSDRSLPQLRRSALLLVSLLVRGARHQLAAKHDEASKKGAGIDVEGGLQALRMPGGSIISLDGAGSSSRVGAKGSEEHKDLLLDPSMLDRARRVLRFVAARDDDAVVRASAEEGVRECDALEVELVTAGRHV